MRSAFFKTPFEYQIETLDEEWKQGDSVKGKLSIINLGKEFKKINEVKIYLARGIKKEIKTGNPNAWKIEQEKILLKNKNFESLKKEQIEWKIKLESDCSISEKSSNYFLLFGDENTIEEGGRIDLKVGLHTILQSFLQTFTTQFDFFEKYRRVKKEWTEVKLLPPDSKEFPKLDYVTCLLRIKEEMLSVKFKFKMKSFGREGESMKVVNKKREYQINVSSAEYLQGGGFPNRNLFKIKISEALNIAKLKVI